jgi:hypothetical protein
VQILIVTPAEGKDAEPYRAAQRWLDGFLSKNINQPINVTGADLTSEQARVLGMNWTVPPHNPPNGEPQPYKPLVYFMGLYLAGAVDKLP